MVEAPKARALADEGGSALVQTTIALVFIISLMFAALSVGMSAMSASSVQAQIQEAVNTADMGAVAASGDPSAALRRELLSSPGLVEDHLFVENCTVSFLPDEAETASVDPKGTQVTTMERTVSVARIEADVCYVVPEIAFPPWLERPVLRQHIDQKQTVQTRIEVG